MNNLAPVEIWYVTGSQNLYGEAVLKKVAANSRKMGTNSCRASGVIDHTMVGTSLYRRAIHFAHARALLSVMYFR